MAMSETVTAYGLQSRISAAGRAGLDGRVSTFALVHGGHR